MHRIDLTKIIPAPTMSYDKLRKEIDKKFLTTTKQKKYVNVNKRPLISNKILRKDVTTYSQYYMHDGRSKQNSLKYKNKFFSAVYHYTAWLPCNFDHKIRMFIIWKNIKELPKCLYCGKEHTKYSKSPFLYGFNLFCSMSCSRKYNNPLANKTDIEILTIRKKLSEKRKGIKFTAEWLKNMTIANGKKEVRDKIKKTCLLKYGVENPGVLGAYSSKSASCYIKKFISERNISNDRCFYKNGGVNNEEFFQMINGKYVSYDLVVFNTKQDANLKNLNAIELILEYNGPWHYLPFEKDIIGNNPCSPYPKAKKIAEVIDFDNMKKEHMLKYIPEEKYIVVWQKLPIISRLGINNIPKNIILVD